MNKKVLIVLAAVFLVGAMVLPTYAVFEALNQDFADLAHRGSLLDETQIQGFITSTTTRHYTFFVIAAAGEVVLLILFVITMWFILRK